MRPVSPGREHIVLLVDQLRGEHAFDRVVDHLLHIDGLVVGFADLRHQTPLGGDIRHVLQAVVAEHRHTIEGTVLFWKIHPASLRRDRPTL